MIILSIQRKEIADIMRSGNYRASLWESSYAFLSPRFTEGYNIINNAVRKRSGKIYSEDESCIWGWVLNPFIDFFTFNGYLNPNEYVALFIEVPDNEVVISDYDLFNSFVQGDISGEDFIISDLSGVPKDSCLQCSFAGVSPNSIKLEVPLTWVEGMTGDIESIYSKVSNALVWYGLYQKKSLVEIE